LRPWAPDHPVLGVEQHDDEVLLVEVPQAAAQDCLCVDWLSPLP